MAQIKKGMAGYAHRAEQADQLAENAAMPTSKSMDDLRVNIPGSTKKGTAKATPLGASDRPITRSATGKHQKIENGTDFSSVDRASTVSGPTRSRSHGDPAPMARQDLPLQRDEYEEMTERAVDEVGDNGQHEHDESSDVPNDPLRQPQQHNDNVQHAYERAPGHPGHGLFAQQQIKGDSYPPTTEGDPSVADQLEGLSPYSTQPAEDHYQKKSNGALPARGGGAGGTRVPMHAADRPQNPGQQNHDPNADLALRNPPMLYGAPPLSSVMAGAASGFSFKPPPAAKQGGSRAQPPAQPQQHGRAPQHHAAHTNVAHRGSAPMTVMSSQQNRVQRHDPGFQQNAEAEPRERQRPMKHPPRRQSTNPQPIPTAESASFQQVRAPPAQRHEPTSRTAEIDELPVGNNRQLHKYRESSGHGDAPTGEDPDAEHDEEPEEEFDEEPDNLDYEEEAIYEMDYAELKAEPFDLDPQADGFKLPDGQQHQTLEVKLQAVAVLPSQVRSAFFTSLPVEQWEEAGDWFLEQFGEVLKKFKAARQDKRKTAKEFEDEIEKRHEAVSKKRKLTEDALGEMKKTGSVVLQGTPKKPKKIK